VKSKVTLSEFKSNLDLVKAYIIESSTKPVTCIEYRTFDEGMSDANLFVLPKENAKDDFEAFITLVNFQLHFYEEWSLTDSTSESVNSIINLWMLPEIEKHSFETLSPAQVHKEIDSIIKQINILHIENKYKEEAPINHERWGVYVNDENVPIETTLEDLGINDVISGIGLDLEWNSIDIMYQTPSSYVYFSWGTGA
jgi:hypothetical protein